MKRISFYEIKKSFQLTECLKDEGRKSRSFFHIPKKQRDALLKDQKENGFENAIDHFSVWKNDVGQLKSLEILMVEWFSENTKIGRINMCNGARINFRVCSYLNLKLEGLEWPKAEMNIPVRVNLSS